MAWRARRIPRRCGAEQRGLAFVSVTVRPAGEQDIDGVVDLLHGHMSAKISRERWRTLLDYPWRPTDAACGTVAVEGGRVVGFLGLVYADRPFAGRTERFCNICAWYLLRDYRARGIGREIQELSISDAEQTYTLVTATAGTDRAFRNVGFVVLDDERYILHRRDASRPTLEWLEGPEAVEALLPPAEQVILDHHRHFNLRHLLITTGKATCYLVVQARKQGEDVNYHQVLYLTDPEFVAAHGPEIADAILEPGKAVFAVDRRFLPEPMPWQSERVRQPRLFSAPRLDPASVDHLYNEIVLLDLKLP
jgi:GNAT superfamily N-acetyltransferase